ncbi:hypothetical protein IGI39_004545 [Enterococcus sp. AZ135]
MYTFSKESFYYSCYFSDSSFVRGSSFIIEESLSFKEDDE